MSWCLSRDVFSADEKVYYLSHENTKIQNETVVRRWLEKANNPSKSDHLVNKIRKLRIFYITRPTLYIGKKLINAK